MRAMRLLLPLAHIAAVKAFTNGTCLEHLSDSISCRWQEAVATWDVPKRRGLGRVERLLEALGEPQRNLPPVIHVAGTNGKGSTIAFMRAALEAAGAATDPLHSSYFHTSTRFAEVSSENGRRAPLRQPRLRAERAACQPSPRRGAAYGRHSDDQSRRSLSGDIKPREFRVLLRDPEEGIIGMVNFCIPSQDISSLDATGHAEAERYGRAQLDQLIMAFRKEGSNLENLEVSIVGGTAQSLSLIHI